MEKTRDPKKFGLEDLEHLKKIEPNGMVLSFYLSSRPDVEIKTTWDSLKHKAKEKIKLSSAPKAEKKVTLGLIEKIDKYLKVLIEINYYHTLVIFASKEEFDVYVVPESIQPDIKISNLPFYKPLEESYMKKGLVFVASVDRTRTNFYTIDWDKYGSSYGFLVYQVPQKIKGGSASWKGLKEKNIQNHIEWHLDEHMKESAEDLYFHFKKEKFKKLIIGGNREVIGKFEKRLHPELKKIIIQKFYGDPEAVLKEVKKDGKEAFEKHRL